MSKTLHRALGFGSASILALVAVACGGSGSDTASTDVGSVDYYVSSAIGDTSVVTINHKNASVTAKSLTSSVGCATPTSPCLKSATIPGQSNSDGSYSPTTQINNYTNVPANTTSAIGQALRDSTAAFGAKLNTATQNAISQVGLNMAKVAGDAASTVGAEAIRQVTGFFASLFTPGYVATKTMATATARNPSDTSLTDQSDMITGHIGIPFPNVSMMNVPAIGGSKPLTRLTDIVGNYNYVAVRCNNASLGEFNSAAAGCSTYYGTVKVASNSTFSLCDSANVAISGAPACTLTASGTVSLNADQKSWVFQATLPRTGSASNRFAAFKNGTQVVATIDFDDSTVFGFGQAVAATQIATSINSITGTYKASSNYGDTTGFVVQRPFFGNGAVASINRDGYQYSATLNSPWNGIATIRGGTTGTGYAIMAGKGIYVYVNNANADKPAFYEIGQVVPSPPVFTLGGLFGLNFRF